MTRAAVTDEPLLVISGLVKEFPGLRALDDVSLDVRSGEIVAVVGHNGSGKSTLVKILAGVYAKDAGEIALRNVDGLQTELHIIHQDLGLAMELTAIENLDITRHHAGARPFAPFSRRREENRARDLLRRFGEPFDLGVPVGRLAPAQRSIVAIARALDGWSHAHNILILDEPTESLHAGEVRVLFDAVAALAAEGAGVIFISHRLDEVLELADRVVVLRDGIKVADEDRDVVDHDRLVAHVTGVAADRSDHGRRREIGGRVLLDIRGLSGDGIKDIDLTVHAGEVVGIAGALGSGREVLPATIFGATVGTATVFDVDGVAYPARSPRRSIARGLAFVPGDRAKFGSVRPMNARENMTLPDLRAVTGRLGAVDTTGERRVAGALIADYGVKPPRADQVFAQFSGGNQQKIVFAKWLRNDPKVLLLEEPTQGVDIGAKQTIYGAIDEAANRGVGVLVCSSEAKELVRLCDRVLVMRNGRVTADLSGVDLTETRLVLEGYGLADGTAAATTEGAE